MTTIRYMVHVDAALPAPGGRQVLAQDPSGNPVELFEARGE